MDISIIITAICNQACFIETNVCYSKFYALHLHLPKCLILTYNYYSPNNVIFIYPMIPNSDKYVEIIHMPSKAYIFRFFHAQRLISFLHVYRQYDLDNISKFLATFMYADNDSYGSTMTFYPSIIGNCKKNLRNKMVQNLVDLYFVKYMCLASSISIIEIKIIIIEMFIKMEKWNNLEIFLL